MQKNTEMFHEIPQLKLTFNKHCKHSNWICRHTCNLCSGKHCQSDSKTVTMFPIKSFAIKPTPTHAKRFESFFIVARISLFKTFFCYSSTRFWRGFFSSLQRKSKIHFSRSWVFTVNARYLKRLLYLFESTAWKHEKIKVK